MGLAALVFSSGCSDQQEKAKTALETGSAYEFTVDDYIEAAALGNLDSVRQFLEAGMTVDAEDVEGNTALLQAARSGEAAVLNHLISQGADVNLVGPGWDTPLIAAAESGDYTCLNLLLKAGAKPDQKNEENWSALTTAAFHGNTDAVDVLAPESRNMLDDALQLAALQGHLEVMDRLLNHGASVYARSREGEWTPLMYASANGHGQAVQLLLNAGANRFALDEKDRTAADLAKESGFADISSLLSEPPKEDELRPSTIEDLAPGIVAKFESAYESLELGGDGSFSLPDAPSFGNGDAGVSNSNMASNQRPVAGVPNQGGSVGAGLQGGGGESGVVSSTRASNVSEPVATEAMIGDIVAGAPQGSATGAGRDVSNFRRQIQTRRLSGSKVATIPSVAERTEVEAKSVERVFQMHEYRESQLPVMLSSVPNRETAEVRVLYGGEPNKTVVKGERIPGTSLEVLRIEPKLVPSKLGNGQLVDMSRILVEDRLSGTRHLIVKDVPARSSEPFAVMSFGDVYTLYDVRAGDEFSGADGTETFRVNDVRQNSVVIEDLQTGETFTVAKAVRREF